MSKAEKELDPNKLRKVFSALPGLVSVMTPHEYQDPLGKLLVQQLQCPRCPKINAFIVVMTPKTSLDWAPHFFLSNMMRLKAIYSVLIMLSFLSYLFTHTIASKYKQA